MRVYIPRTMDKRSIQSNPIPFHAIDSTCQDPNILIHPLYPAASKSFLTESSLKIFFICVSSSFSPPARRIFKSSMARIFFNNPRTFLSWTAPPLSSPSVVVAAAVSGGGPAGLPFATGPFPFFAPAAFLGLAPRPLSGVRGGGFFVVVDDDGGGAEGWTGGAPSTSSLFSAVSLCFLASRFFLFFDADLDDDVLSWSGDLDSSTASEPGTSLLRGLVGGVGEEAGPLPAAVEEEDNKAVPPSSSRLNASGVFWPRAPGGRYAPADFCGTFLVLM